MYPPIFLNWWFSSQVILVNSGGGYQHLGVSKNSDTPKSSILIGFSIINHPFWGTTIFGNTYLWNPPTLERNFRRLGWRWSESIAGQEAKKKFTRIDAFEGIFQSLGVEWKIAELRRWLAVGGFLKQTWCPSEGNLVTRSPFGMMGNNKQRSDTSFLCQQPRIVVFFGCKVLKFCNDASTLPKTNGSELKKDDRVSEFGTFGIPCGLVNLSPRPEIRV